MRRKLRPSKLLALLLVIALLFSNSTAALATELDSADSNVSSVAVESTPADTPPDTPADTDTPTDPPADTAVQVSSFEELAEDLVHQQVTTGTALESLSLPTVLNGLGSDGTVLELENITWVSEPEYAADTAGDYTFTPVLPEGYVLAEGAELPGITVTLEEKAPETQPETQPEPKPEDEVSALIGQLPSAEEFQQWKPALEMAEDDPGYQKAYDAAVAEYRQQIGTQVKAAREAYELLTDEQKLLLDAELLAKLEALETALASQPVKRAPKAEGTIYVSQDGTGTGISAEDPAKFEDALSAAKSGDTFILVGTVTLPKNWETPAADITIKGQGTGASTLMMMPCSINASTPAPKPSISLNGALTLDELTLDVKRENQYGNIFAIAANGHSLVFGSGFRTSDDTSNYSGYVFGGGYYEDIGSGTHIENYGTLLVTDIYGGGCGANVTGDTYILQTGSSKQLAGGGYTPYGSTGAHIYGNTTIVADGGMLTSRNHLVFGGGYANNAPANVSGSTSVTVNNSGSYITVYGGGRATNSGEANVGGDAAVSVTNTNMSNNNSSVFGGGYGYYSSASKQNPANIGGNVSITYSGNNFGYVYGGGEANCTVSGSTTIHVDACTGNPVLYAGGKGSSKYSTVNTGDVTIHTGYSLVDVYSQGDYGQVDGFVTIDLQGGGASREDTVFDCNLYNYDKGSKANPQNGSKVLVSGDSTITEIYNFTDIEILAGGALREHSTVITAYGKTRDVKLLQNCGNLVVQEGGTLDLLQTNEITGNADISGNLTIEALSTLVVDGTVSSTDTASYTSTDFLTTYTNDHPFLQTKSAVVNPIPAFSSTDASYLVEDRAGTAPVEHEWYLFKEAITLYPEDYTIYTGGEGGNVQNPSFPRPIYLIKEKDGTISKLDDTATFLVDNQEWNDPDNPYPFVVRYFDKNGEEITSDKAYGDFTARIVPLDPNADIRLSDGTPLKFEEGKLRIRYVSSLDQASNNALTTEGTYYTDSEDKSQAMAKAEEGNVPAVILPESSNIYLNGNKNYVYPADADSKIGLLFDKILPSQPGSDNSEFQEMLAAHAKEQGFDLTNMQTEYKYLDLVDSNNSNAWVSSSNGCDVFWPYPAGTGKDTDFTLLHFEGLHREYRMDGQQTLPEQIAASQVKEITDIQKTENGIWFHIPESGFSPFVLASPETIEISGSKTWDDHDNQDGKRPESITIRLYANGRELTDRTTTVTEKDGWKWNFTNLLKYENGTEIVYTITEDAVADYTTTVTGFDVVNSYTPGKTSVFVAKNWQDSNNQDGIRPDSITIKLLADGKDTGEKLVLNESNYWRGTFKNLYTHSNGKKIVYTVEEEAVEGYQSTITGDATAGFMITNSHTPNKPSNPDNPDGNKPSNPDNPDGNKPNKPDQNNKTPQTGDNFNAAFWIALCSISLLGLCLMSLILRRRNKITHK